MKVTLFNKLKYFKIQINAFIQLTYLTKSFHLIQVIFTDLSETCQVSVLSSEYSKIKSVSPKHRKHGKNEGTCIKARDYEMA